MQLIPQHEPHRSEFIKHGAYSLIPALVVATLFYYVWVNGVYSQLEELVTSAPVLPEGEAGVVALVMFGTGLYTVWLLLFSTNYGKLYQGLLLSLVSVIVVIALAGFGLGIPNIEPTLLNGASFLFGAGVGIISEASTLSKKLNNRKNTVEFSIATYGLVGLIAILVLGANILNWMLIDQSTPRTLGLAGFYVAASVSFLYALNGFVQLSIENLDEEPMLLEIVGPQQSGKTYTALGLWLTARRSDRFDTEEPQGDLFALITAYQETIPDPEDEIPDTLEWDIIGNLRDQVKDIKMTLIPTGGVAVSRISINIRDHSGEHLENIAKRFGYDPEETVPVATDGGSDHNDNDDDFTGKRDATIDADVDAKDEAVENSDEDEAVENSDEDEAVENSDEDEDTEADLDTDESDLPVTLTDETTSSGGDTDDDNVTMEEGIDMSAEDADSGSSHGESSDGASTSDTEDGEQDLSMDGDSKSEPSGDEESPDGSSDAEEGDTTYTEQDDQEESANGDDSIPDQMVDRIEDANKLVMLIDSERFLGYEVLEGDPGLQAEEMESITSETDAEVILAASKADYLLDLLNYNVDPHEDGEVTYEKFRRDATEEMRERNATIDALVAAADKNTIYPVYFETKEVEEKKGENKEDEDEDGDQVEKVRKPVPNEYGQMKPFGFDHLLDEVCRD